MEIVFTVEGVDAKTMLSRAYQIADAFFGYAEMEMKDGVAIDNRLKRPYRLSWEPVEPSSAPALFGTQWTAEVRAIGNATDPLFSSI